MGVVQRRVTKSVAHRAVPAVILDKGWVIEVDGVQTTVTKVVRIGDGRYTVETDSGSFTWGAADRIPLVSTG